MPKLILQPTDGHDANIYETISGVNSTIIRIGNLYIGSDQYNRGLFRFNVSALTSAVQATCASLEITNVQEQSFFMSASSYRCYRVTETAWAATGVTWNKYDGSANSWATVGGDFTTAITAQANIATSTGDLLFTDMAALVNDAILNRSGVLDLIVVGTEVASCASYLTAYASEYDGSVTDARPKLTVSYTDIEPPILNAWTVDTGPADWSRR